MMWLWALDVFFSWLHDQPKNIHGPIAASASGNDRHMEPVHEGDERMGYREAEESPHVPLEP